MGMFLPAIASAGIQTLGSLFGGRSQRRAADAALRAQRENYAQQQQLWNPYRQGGLTAFSQMQDGDFNRNFTLADFMKDPGYDFRKKEGQDALEASAAARGGLMSGAALRAITQYGQDYASNEFDKSYNRWSNDLNNRFNRLNTVANYGMQATGQLSGAANNWAGAQAQNATDKGNINAAMIGNIANAWGGVGNQMTGWNMYQQQEQDRRNNPYGPNPFGMPTYFPRQYPGYGGPRVNFSGGDLGIILGGGRTE